MALVFGANPSTNKGQHVCRMHIALVTPYFPTPTVPGGRTRIARLSSALAQEGQVHLFSALVEEDLTVERWRCGGGADPYARVVTSVLEAEALPGKGPPRVRRFPRVLRHTLRAAHDASPFDVIVLAHSYAGPVLEDMGRVTVVLDEPDVRSHVELHNLRAQTSRIIPRLFAVRQWQRFERTIWAKVDAITVGRARDQAMVRDHRPDTGVLIPNGVDVHDLPYVPPSRREGNNVLFVGDMRSPATLLAVRELAERVLPKLRVRVPDATLTLAGLAPPPEVRQLEGEDVRVVGGRDVKLLLRNHCAFAIPPALGSEGSKEVLEPLSCGMPVLAPPLALRDMPLKEEKDFLGIRSVEDLADRLAGVLVHRSKLDEMALSARAVMERHDWQDIGERFVRVVMATVAKNQKR